MATNEGVEASASRPEAPPSGWLGPLALFAYGSAVAFWLWAKWLFSPQMFFLPPLPPVEVLVSLVQNTLGPWFVAFITVSSLGLIALDAFKSRSAPSPGWWQKSLLRGSAETVAIHVAVWVAGTLLFFSIMALLPGSEVHALSTNDPVVRGLVLFTTFLSLLMSGPITALVIAARSVSQRRRDGFPASFLATLNHSVAILLVPLAVLWVLSGYPRETLQSFAAPTAAVQSEDLLIAARDGDAAQVRTLLARGAAVNHQDRSGTTPLIAASANGHEEIVQALVAAKADANLKDASGRTALMAAAANRQSEIVAALLAAKADVEVHDAEGKSALILAALAGDAGIVRVLHRAGADANATPPLGDTALISASRRGDIEVVRALLDAEANASDPNTAGETALQVARRLNHREVVTLLEAKAKR
jgi:ankyrin repeat protein